LWILAESGVKSRKQKRKGKKMRTTFLKTIGGVALAGSVIAAAMTSGIFRNAQAVAAQAPCSVHTLRGSYVFAAHGWNIVGSPPNTVALPKAIVEGIDFNGDGTLVVPFATASINGTINRSSGGLGTYTVEADCTGTLTFPGPGISFDIFVQPGDGKQVWMIQTAPTVTPPGPPVFEGTATKVSP
jgi:hypothetical protein